MLLYARFLPTGLWTFAKEAFTHVYNLFPTTTSKGWISPHEFETGKVPDLTKLKVWGCKCCANAQGPMEVVSSRGLAPLLRHHDGGRASFESADLDARYWWRLVVRSKHVRSLG